jgi:hypothetical protein
MGLGKTFVGSEKMAQLGLKNNLVVCQKSKVDDWVQHFKEYYNGYEVYDGTDEADLYSFLTCGATPNCKVCIINYDLLIRRPEIATLHTFTLMLDESSLIQNEKSKRTEFILKKLQPTNVILLSGTPCGGKYEKLLPQCKLLGWNVTKKQYYADYVVYHEQSFGGGFPVKIVDGYKNVDVLKQNLRLHGAVFMKTDDVFNLPSQTDININVSTTQHYKRFLKSRYVNLDGVEFVGDTPLKRMLYARQLCGGYNFNKLKAFEDLLQSTEDRLIVFYNFDSELDKLTQICSSNDRPISVVNGHCKDLSAFENFENSVTLIQFQSGAFGLNLQQANKIVYFSPPLSSELFEQSKKRTHRLGQDKPCFYYYLTCGDSIEQHIYEVLKVRKDYTEKLFEKEFG